MTETGQSVAMITDSAGQPIGALTKEQILRRLDREDNSSAAHAKTR